MGESSVLASFVLEEGVSVGRSVGEERWGVGQAGRGEGLLGFGNSFTLSLYSSCSASVLLHFLQFVLQVIFSVRAFSSLSFFCSSGPVFLFSHYCRTFPFSLPCSGFPIVLFSSVSLDLLCGLSSYPCSPPGSL